MMDQEMAFDGVPMTYQFSCHCDELAVRSLLIDLRAALIGAALSQDVISSVEIAVAEGLNNIVEHACADLPDARLHVDLKVNAAHVFVMLIDPGVPLPPALAAQLAQSGKVPDLSVPVQALPEGGFGWNLIRTLADRLDYSRVNETNRLKMWFVVAPDGA